MEFELFPKIGRLNRDCTITEKIDGTNGQLLFDEYGNLLVGSRTRQIHPEGEVFHADGTPVKGTDNMGFAKWAYDNQSELFDYLGPGRHYGEWAGYGIQRGYNLDHKRFYLFNTFRWNTAIPQELYNIGLDVVPVMLNGPFDTDIVNVMVELLRTKGSCINNFPKPEGVIVYHHTLRTYAKVTCQKDGRGKGYDDRPPS